MTSLIDVIFLLLLFFMLSSTFSRFAEVELHVASASGISNTQPDSLLFLRVAKTGLTLNGQPITAETIGQSLGPSDGPKTVLVSVAPTATAQALADVLVALRPYPDLSVSVLEAS